MMSDGSSLQTTMPTGNTSPIIPPSIVVWLCGKIRQLNTCTDMYIHSFLCVHVVCVCSPEAVQIKAPHLTVTARENNAFPLGYQHVMGASWGICIFPRKRRGERQAEQLWSLVCSSVRMMNAG